DRIVKRGRVKGIHDRAMVAIRGFQPYVKPEALQKHPLLHLRQLSNRDKHHMLAIAIANAGFQWRFVAEDGRVLRSDQTTELVRDGGVLAVLPIEFMIDGQK